MERRNYESATVWQVSLPPVSLCITPDLASVRESTLTKPIMSMPTLHRLKARHPVRNPLVFRELPIPPHVKALPWWQCRSRAVTSGVLPRPPFLLLLLLIYRLGQSPLTPLGTSFEKTVPSVHRAVAGRTDRQTLLLTVKPLESLRVRSCYRLRCRPLMMTRNIPLPPLWRGNIPAWKTLASTTGCRQSRNAVGPIYARQR